MSESRDRTSITRLVLDVLKPHKPDIVDFSRMLARVRGVRKVESSVTEVDTETETVKIMIEGSDLNVDEIGGVIRDLGGAIHSVDAVVVERPEHRR